MRKSWNGVIEPTVRSSSPYFESLKWNPPEPADHGEARHHLLDVGVGQVVAEVDQALGPVAGALGQQQRRAPVVVHRRVERRLVGLVLGVHRPVAGQVGVDLPQPGEHPLELAPEAGLARVVHAVAQPHGQRPRPQLEAEVDHVVVVLDRRPAGALVDVGQAAELVGHRAVAGGRRVVLERVGVHGVEGDAPLLGVAPQRGGPRPEPRVVPRHVEADRPVGAGEGVEGGDVVDLLDRVARLAPAREAAEAGAAGAHRPRRRRRAEPGHLGHHGLAVDPRPGHHVQGVGQVGLVPGQADLVVLVDAAAVDRHRRLLSLTVGTPSVPRCPPAGSCPS